MPSGQTFTIHAKKHSSKSFKSFINERIKTTMLLKLNKKITYLCHNSDPDQRDFDIF